MAYMLQFRGCFTLKYECTFIYAIWIRRNSTRLRTHWISYVDISEHYPQIDPEPFQVYRGYQRESIPHEIDTHLGMHGDE